MKSFIGLTCQNESKRSTKVDLGDIFPEDGFGTPMCMKI